MTKNLADRVVLLVGVGVSGATMSNGRATALAYAARGARLVLADKDPAALDDCRRAVVEAGHEPATMPLDATREAEVEAAVAKILASEGRIDVLHNNIGIACPGRITRLTEAEIDRGFDVNLKSIMWLCKHVLPAMEKQGSGIVTNVSSISSIRHIGINAPLYDVTKAGLNALTRHIAVAYGPKGIRANAIVVGMMDTPLARGGIAQAGRQIDEIYDGYVQRVPLRRMGTGHDTGSLSAFLASDEASYINGAEIVLDGGLTVRSG